MKKYKNQIAIIFIVTCLIFTLVYFGFTQDIWEHDLLNKWASLITIISVVGIPLVYFLNQNIKENEQKQKIKDELNRASANLLVELDDTLNALNETKHNDLKTVESGNEKFHFINRKLNHDFYDSLIFSGKINFLESDIQQPMQDTFQKIKDHNFYIRKIRNIEDRANLPGDTTSKTLRYYKILSKDEEQLLEDIPKMKKELDKILK